jgi:hypothetical protein
MSGKKAIDATTVERFAREYADYRLGGCPSGGAEVLIRRMKDAARRLRVSYSELWGEVNAAAYRIIDADGRSSLGGA